uniref:Major facilitator superfamily (MFS) profile domain-containing protein n=1 Tax=Eutreptiella gymnastica TaxID=73025 RepID=A0A7S1J346_9EUGL|mmetsp:Transcript_63419/g.113171  ORF Transcript_63419/g.113171 Transcript_63419/m.113171 type:complete len:675 (+) Transcript_63419:57-2081(+)
MGDCERDPLLNGLRLAQYGAQGNEPFEPFFYHSGTACNSDDLSPHLSTFTSEPRVHALKENAKLTRSVFMLLVLLQVLVHYDAGAIPASLGPDEQKHKLHKPEENLPARLHKHHKKSDTRVSTLSSSECNHEHHTIPIYSHGRYLNTIPNHGDDDAQQTRLHEGSSLQHDYGDSSLNRKGMIHDFKLGYAEVGLLQSLVYFGLTVSCSFGGSLLLRYQAKWLVTVGLTIDVLCLGLMAMTHSATICIGSRFLLGLAQAYLIMYLPVWIDEFAPDGYATTWMSIAQAGVPVGIMCGYMSSGMLAAHTGLNWRYSFGIQVCLLIPAILAFVCLPEGYVNLHCVQDVRDPNSPARQYHHDNVFIQIWLQLKAVLRRPLFVLNVLSLSALYYVVAALQLWVTPYVHGPPLNQPLSTIIIAYTLVSCSAPVLGLLTGGWFMDHMFGGYRSGMHKTAQVALCFGVVATVAAFLVTITTSFWFFFLLIWIVLYCGAACVPCCTGISLCSVPAELRPVASSVGMMVYNLLGWFAGPLLTGVVAQVTGNLAWGFRFTMGWSVVSFLCMLGVYYITCSQEEGKKDEALLRHGPEQQDPDQDLGGDLVSFASSSWTCTSPLVVPLSRKQSLQVLCRGSDYNLTPRARTESLGNGSACSHAGSSPFVSPEKEEGRKLRPGRGYSSP